MGLFSKIAKRRTVPSASMSAPPGKLVYSFGDIHGRDDLFGELLDKIDEDRSQRPDVEAVPILPGDLVDASYFADDQHLASIDFEELAAAFPAAAFAGSSRWFLSIAA